MTAMPEPSDEVKRIPTGRFEWEKVIRRAILKPSSVKLIALVMATYADGDGSRVRPGQLRLAAVMGTGVSTVERGQRELERLGFLELVAKGHSFGRGHPGGFASVYQLTLPEDLFERVQMLDPDEKKHPSPMTDESRKHPSPMTDESSDIPVNPAYIPVTGAETPVNFAYIPVTHDDPPVHNHQTKDQNINHHSFSPHLSNASASENTQTRSRTLANDDMNDGGLYEKSRDHLQHSGRHQHFMNQARRENPDMNVRDRVITAAALAGYQHQNAS